MLLQLQLAQRLLEHGVGDVGLAHLAAHQRQVILVADRAGAQVAGLHRRHLRGPLATRRADGVVHADGDGAGVKTGLVGEPGGVHHLVALEVLDQRLQRLEGQADAGFQRGAAELVGIGDGAQEEAGHQVLAQAGVLNRLRRCQGPGFHQRSQLYRSGIRT